MKKIKKHVLRKINKSILSVCLCVTFLACLIINIPVIASPEELSSLQEQKAEEESKKEAAQAQKTELEAYLEEINKETASLAAQAADLQAEAKNKKLEIESTAAELDKATIETKKQYQNMKNRIKLIYEKGKEGYLEAILSAGSISELLNRTRYVSEIYSFDNEILANYNKKVEEIKNMKLKLEADEKNLIELQANAQTSLEKAQSSIEDTKSQIKAYMESIAASTERIQGYEAEIVAQGNSVGTGAGSAPATGAGQTTQLSIVQGEAILVSPEELDMMAAMIYCEAGGEGFEEMLGVASVICNRIKSSRYPDDMYSVLWQSGQFAPTWEGKYELALARGVPDICYEAANKALSGYSNVGDAIGFLLASTGIEGIVIGKIVFF